MCGRNSVFWALRILVVGYVSDMGLMSKVVKLGIAKKIYDEVRKPHNQKKAKDAWASFQDKRNQRGTPPR